MECERYRDQMLDVLYGEAEAETARQLEEHQAACEGCREELAAFRHLRRDLRAWTLPAVGAPRPRPAPALRLRPALAWAAGLLMASGAALGLSGSELRYQDGRLSFRLGRVPASTDVASLLAAQEARFQQEIQALKGPLAVAAPTGVPQPVAAGSDAALGAQLRRLIQESESRQAVMMNASLADLEDRLADQRRLDLERVGTSLALVDGRASLNAARNAALMAQAFPAAQQR
jgi:hypothetical protein